MTTSENLTQAEINKVWSAVWKKDTHADTYAFFKHRLFIEGYYVFKRHIPRDAKTILDVGGGSGRYGIALARDFPNSEVRITDILPESLTVGRRISKSLGVSNVKFEQEDVNALSYPDNSFDVVFCDVVIQHLPESTMAICEMLRVLRPGGRLIVSAANYWNFHTFGKFMLRLTDRPYSYGYEKSYSSKNLATLIHECGGQVIARDGFYVAYGIFRLRYIHPAFAIVGKMLNRLITYADQFTDRWFSRHFGFEIFCVASK